MKILLKRNFKLENAESFYLQYLEGDYSSNYLHNVFYTIKYYCELNNREFKIKKPKVDMRRRESLTKIECIKFLSIINDYRDRTIILLGLTTGLRPGEILNLNMEDIDLEKQTILVKNTKIHEDRITFLDDTVKPYLELYLEKRKKYASDNALFISYKSGERLSLRRAQVLFWEYSKKSKVHCTMYMMRHTFASLYIQKGGDIKILKELMGHKNIKTTERYIHENPEMIREGYRKYAPRF